MKNTKFILKDNFINLDILETSKSYLKPITIPITLVVGIAGMAIVLGMLPITVTMDGYRTIKYSTIKFERKHHIKKFVYGTKVYMIYHNIDMGNRFVLHEFATVLRKIA